MRGQVNPCTELMILVRNNAKVFERYGKLPDGQILLLRTLIIDYANHGNNKGKHCGSMQDSHQSAVVVLDGSFCPHPDCNKRFAPYPNAKSLFLHCKRAHGLCEQQVRELSINFKGTCRLSVRHVITTLIAAQTAPGRL